MSSKSVSSYLRVGGVVYAQVRTVQPAHGKHTSLRWRWRRHRVAEVTVMGTFPHSRRIMGSAPAGVGGYHGSVFRPPSTFQFKYMYNTLQPKKIGSMHTLRRWCKSCR